MNQQVLLLTTPFVQLNTPYPATPYLKGYLNTQNIACEQADLSLEVILKLFSRQGLTQLFEEIEQYEFDLDDNLRCIIALQSAYINTIDDVIAFLQHRNATLAPRISNRNFLPEGGRFAQLDMIDEAFGYMGDHDKARHLATLYLEDISDLISQTIDPDFGFSRYAESISSAASSFDEIEAQLQEDMSFIELLMIESLEATINIHKPTLIGLTVPFPGNLLSALRCGQWIKEHHPKIKVLMGGGYPNTELRSLSDATVFKYVDFISLDDGEITLKYILEHLNGERPIHELHRTYTCIEGIVKYHQLIDAKDVKQIDLGVPDFRGLPLDRYISVIETANPMNRLWSDGRWNKMMLAHGCYWAKCTFCDVSLDYIGRFEQTSAQIICDRVEQVIEQTGERGFHFIDEAAPPALLKSFAIEVIKRNLNITWWTNVRFERSFTSDLCQLLSKAGCIAVSGGLEVASDRLLKLINKGVNIEQVSQVTQAMTNAGIMVHAYLMYGFPTQTTQETIDSLEHVRQMFETGIIQSGFWHRFAMTAHSPVGLNPKKFGVKSVSDEIGSFANNEIGFIDQTPANHEAMGLGLRRSIYNYMHGVGFELPLHQWFETKVPKTKVPKQLIENYLNQQDFQKPKAHLKMIWLGVLPQQTIKQKRKKKRVFDVAELTTFHSKGLTNLSFEQVEGEWLHQLLCSIQIDKGETRLFSEIEIDFEKETGNDFFIFWNSKNMQVLRSQGLILI